MIVKHLKIFGRVFMGVALVGFLASVPSACSDSQEDEDKLENSADGDGDQANSNADLDADLDGAKNPGANAQAEVVPDPQPAPAPAVAQEAPREEFVEYTIRSGNTLSRIAKRALGDAMKWPMIAAVNPQITNPNVIYPGQVIKIPVTGNPQAQQFAQDYRANNNISMATPSSSHNEMYHSGTAAANVQHGSVVTETVTKGMTLSLIAKRLMGSAMAWKQLWEANKALLPDPNKLEIGQVLKLTIP